MGSYWSVKVRRSASLHSVTFGTLPDTPVLRQQSEVENEVVGVKLQFHMRRKVQQITIVYRCSQCFRVCKHNMHWIFSFKLPYGVWFYVAPMTTWRTFFCLATMELITHSFHKRTNY